MNWQITNFPAFINYLVFGFITITLATQLNSGNLNTFLTPTLISLFALGYFGQKWDIITNKKKGAKK
jgi:hypothetical protein